MEPRRSGRLRVLAPCLTHPAEDALLCGFGEDGDDLQQASLPSKEESEAPGIGLKRLTWQGLDGFDLSRKLVRGNTSDVFENAGYVLVCQIIQSPLRRPSQANRGRQLGEGLAEPFNGAC